MDANPVIPVSLPAVIKGVPVFVFHATKLKLVLETILVETQFVFSLILLLLLNKATIFATKEINPRRDPASHCNLNLLHSLLATETIDTPYLDGIRTHRSRVTPLMKQALYLQATTAGSLNYIYWNIF